MRCNVDVVIKEYVADVGATKSFDKVIVALDAGSRDAIWTEGGSVLCSNGSGSGVECCGSHGAAWFMLWSLVGSGSGGAGRPHTCGAYDVGFDTVAALA